jgi:hypothetical protein
MKIKKFNYIKIKLILLNGIKKYIYIVLIIKHILNYKKKILLSK